MTAHRPASGTAREGLWLGVALAGSAQAYECTKQTN